MCQICGKIGHLTLDCYHIMGYAYQGKHPPTKLVVMATASNAAITQEQPWLVDSVTIDRVTASFNNLDFQSLTMVLIISLWEMVRICL